MVTDSSGYESDNSYRQPLSFVIDVTPSVNVDDPATSAVAAGAPALARMRSGCCPMKCGTSTKTPNHSAAIKY